MSIAAGAQADIATLNGGLGYGGGAFTAVIQREVGSPFGVGANISVKTFCIESTSYFQPGASYYTEYATSATPGGGGGSGGYDPIGSATAWLFAAAVQGQLGWNLGSGDVNFNINNTSHNRIVQSTIWHLEGESQPFALSAAEQLVRTNLLNQAYAAASLANGSLFGVRVMRLWTSRSGGPGNYAYAGDRQDQMVLVPLPPAAWGGATLMAGVIGLAYLRRRQQQA